MTRFETAPLWEPKPWSQWGNGKEPARVRFDQLGLRVIEGISEKTGQIRKPATKVNPAEAQSASLAAMETVQKIEVITDCITRFAELEGAGQLRLPKKQRAKVDALVGMMEAATRELVAVAKLDKQGVAIELEQMPDVDVAKIPVWSKQVRRADGTRIYALEFFDTHWAELAARGAVTPRQLRAHNKTLYNCMAKEQHRKGETLGDLFDLNAAKHRKLARYAMVPAGRQKRAPR